MGATVEAVDSKLVRVILGKTDGGKEIVLIRKPDCSVRMIAFTTGGQLPEQLQGGFSSVQAAHHACDSYLAKVKNKEIKADGTRAPAKGAAATTKSTGRGSK